MVQPISSATLEQLFTVVEGGAQSEAKTASRGAAPLRQTRESSNTAGKGVFDVERYLADYEIEFTVKPGDGCTLYCLAECLFDISHTGKDAAIIQNDETGSLGYHCFHDSCREKRWKDARDKISGGDSLVKYCQDSEQPSYSFEELEQRIAETDDIKVLTEDILQDIALGDLSEAQVERLLQGIRAKTKVSLGALHKTVVKFQKATTDHYTIALTALSLAGDGNVISTGAFTWLWDDRGVWKPVNDRVIKQFIHQAAPDKCLTKGLVESALDLVKTTTFIPDEDFVSKKDGINCLNGELIWEEGQWRLTPHDRDNHRTTQIPVEYNPEARAPRFEKFLDEVFAPDEDRAEKKLCVLECIGYTLLSETRYEKFIMLFGSGANGKSVLMALLAAIVGTPNLAGVQPSQLENKFQCAHLHNKLLNLVTEIPEGHKIDDARLKAITSGEMTTAEHKNKTPFNFKPYCTCWFGTNHLPHTNDFSEALFRRAILVPFNRVFAEHEQDRHLVDALKGEASGILNLALAALAGVFQRNGFTESESMKQAAMEWRRNADQAQMFVEECCDLNSEKHCPTGKLYEAYRQWADFCGIRQRLTLKGFVQRLKLLNMGIEPRPGSNGGPRVLVGLSLNHTFYEEFPGFCAPY
jgi:P4 family phage/plasmid primase-like protien